MLHSMKQLYGAKLGASDGNIGHVKDFYFDDQNWVIRYVIADTGSWLQGRQVLISPHAIARLDPGEKLLRVNLTREQIENSPLIETHKPVSRQYETEQDRLTVPWPRSIPPLRPGQDARRGAPRLQKRTIWVSLV